MSVYVLQGLRPWLLQRISAVYIALFTVYLVVEILNAHTVSHAAWRSWFFSTPNTIATGLFVFALLLHAWIGMRDIVLDYIHNTMARVLALCLIVGILAGSGFWMLRILLMTVNT